MPAVQLDTVQTLDTTQDPFRCLLNRSSLHPDALLEVGIKTLELTVEASHMTQVQQATKPPPPPPLPRSTLDMPCLASSTTHFVQLVQPFHSNFEKVHEAKEYITA